MSFSLIVTVAIVASAIGSPGQVMSVTQTGLAADRCPKEQMMLESECVDLPKLLKKPAVRYPGMGERAVVVGTVGFTATLQPDGTIGDIRVTHPLAPKLGFEDAAIKALKKWRYEAVLRHGKAVTVPF